MIEIPWLTPAEQRTYRVFSRMTRDLFNHFDCDLKRDVGIPRSYYELLFVLGEAHPAPMRMTDLATGTRSNPSRITYAVTRLEQDGLLRREANPADARGWTVRLTDEGADMLRRAAERHAQSIRTYLFDALTERQLDDLRRISEKTIARIEETTTAAASS
ncbi:MarR family winged helix-turn-helix transcriptional regulator [Fodinicola acaciae]|uniref:MarR family winged helix-turn-helix transcriptional regulator n=1 Tax=Fodinicola acaciae TaxID=2681555 RepID=UPI001C9E79F9|nr:MarR family transcriptional regulator [Fodinicola acaciae]